MENITNTQTKKQKPQQHSQIAEKQRKKILKVPKGRKNITKSTDEKERVTQMNNIGNEKDIIRDAIDIK